MWQHKPCCEASVNTASCTEPCAWLRAAGGYVESAASIISLRLGTSSCSSQFTLQCAQTSLEQSALSDIQLQSHCAENYRLPSKQRKVKGQGSCHGRGFTHRCLQNTHCSHRLHMTIYFSHFFITLTLLLFGPQA